MFLVAALISTACTDSPAGLRDRSVAEVTVHVTSPPTSMNGFAWNSDTVDVAVEVRDGQRVVIRDLPAAWRLEMADGTPVPDSIAYVRSVGTQAATIIFRRESLVGVVATVVSSDGTLRSGRLYMNWTREP